MVISHVFILSVKIFRSRGTSDIRPKRKKEPRIRNVLAEEVKLNIVKIVKCT